MICKEYNRDLGAFFALVRAGLWETEVRLSQYNDIDYSRVLSFAEEQSVVGLVAAGMEHVEDIKIPKPVLLQFIGQTLQLEQQNTAMNYFIGVLVDKMRKEGINTLLLKGQGIAQCYERPLWRSCGDVDFFLSDDNYNKAKEFLVPLAASVEKEEAYMQHLGMTIDPWVVELHGSLRSGLSFRVNNVLDEIRREIFFGGTVRPWTNGLTQVFLPSADNDAIYVFAHFMGHFCKGGVGLRQVCDWCRLLWTYRDTIDVKKLETRVKKMGFVSEWKAFAAFTVEYLGMPVEAMPMYSSDKRWKRKATRIGSYILQDGNFGHNRDTSYFSKYPYIIRKVISFGRRIGDLFRLSRIFPWDSVRFLPSIVIVGLKSAMKGE